MPSGSASGPVKVAVGVKDIKAGIERAWSGWRTTTGSASIWP